MGRERLGAGIAVASIAALIVLGVHGSSSPSGTSSTGADPRVTESETSPHLSAFLTTALGSPRISAPLERLDVSIEQRGGYTFTRGSASVSLSAEGTGRERWHWYTNGSTRQTPFGAETVVIEPGRTEQFLTVERRQGPKTWRWRLRASGLTPRLIEDGTIEFRTSAGSSSLVLLPVGILDVGGNDVTPPGLRWSLDRDGTRWWLELRLDDANLPLPYVIDPAITFRASSTGSSGGATTLDIPRPAGIVAGDFLIAQIAVRGGSTTTITAPTTGTPWTLLREESTTAIKQAIYYKFATASEPTTYTWSFSSSQKASGGIIAYIGVDTTSPIDGSSGNTGNGTAITALSVATTGPDRKIVGFFGLARTTGITPPASMTERYQTQSGGGGGTTDHAKSVAADADQAAAAPSGDKTATAAQGADWVAQLVALRPVAAAPRTTSTVVDCPATTPANSPATCTVTVTDTDTGTKSPPQGTVDFDITAQPAGSSPTLTPDPCALTANVDGESSSCAVMFSSTKAGDYTIKGTYVPAATSVHAASSGTDTIKVTPGPPAIVTVDPLTATNEVDTEHCVTATVTDAFGNPNAGVTVLFSVTGSNQASGSGTTGADGTTGEFCYTGVLFGEDVIRATADTDESGTADPGEPFGTAIKTWTPPEPPLPCDVIITEGGWIVAQNGDRGSFGGNAHDSPTGEPSGQQEYQDHGPAQPMNVHSTSIVAVVCSEDGKQASIFGFARIDGSALEFVFRIDVQDLGEPGVGQDTYRIRLSNGYDSGGGATGSGNILMGGNVQILLL